MSLESRKFLVIDLKNKASSVKTYTDMHKYIGGVGIGIKLLQQTIESDPIIFSVGPFNGYFPYASKTAVVTNSGGVIEDTYLGGTLSTRLKFTGLDGIALINVSDDPVVLDIRDHEVGFLPEDTDIDTLGLPGRRSRFEFCDGRFLLDCYFKTPEKVFEDKILEKNIKAMIISGTETQSVFDFENYTRLYKQLLKRKEDITINSGLNPSCSNCPMGCIKAQEGEIGGNVLLHSLVSCQFAEKIYSDVGIVFMCLNALGYNYTHEDIENLPKLIQNTLKEF